MLRSAPASSDTIFERLVENWTVQDTEKLKQVEQDRLEGKIKKKGKTQGRLTSLQGRRGQEKRGYGRYIGLTRFITDDTNLQQIVKKLSVKKAMWEKSLRGATSDGDNSDKRDDHAGKVYMTENIVTQDIHNLAALVNSIDGNGILPGADDSEGGSLAVYKRTTSAQTSESDDYRLGLPSGSFHNQSDGASAIDQKAVPLNPLHPSEIPNLGYGFPLSSTLKKEKFALGRNCRMLSCQPADRLTQGISYYIHLFLGLPGSRSPRLQSKATFGRQCSSIFSIVVLNRYIVRLQLVLTDKWKMYRVSQEDLEEYYQNHLDNLRKLECFFRGIFGSCGGRINSSRPTGLSQRT
ncbi:putative methyltransferase-like 5, partial [Homarus americanus]